MSDTFELSALNWNEPYPVGLEYSTALIARNTPKALSDTVTGRRLDMTRGQLRKADTLAEPKALGAAIDREMSSLTKRQRLALSVAGGIVAIAIGLGFARLFHNSYVHSTEPASLRDKGNYFANVSGFGGMLGLMGGYILATVRRERQAHAAAIRQFDRVAVQAEQWVLPAMVDGALVLTNTDQLRLSDSSNGYQPKPSGIPPATTSIAPLTTQAPIGEQGPLYTLWPTLQPVAYGRVDIPDALTPIDAPEPLAALADAGVRRSWPPLARFE